MSAERESERNTGADRGSREVVRANGEAVVVPRPSNLPPNPSVGELVTEIDRARHDAARTVNALVNKLDVKSAVRRKTHQQVEALRWDGRRVIGDLRDMRSQVLDSVPPPVAAALVKVGELVRMVPVPVRVGVVVVLLLRPWRRFGHHDSS